MDISRGLVNTTLDIIGEGNYSLSSFSLAWALLCFKAVFDYHFGSLDGKEEKNEFSEVFHNLL